MTYYDVYVARADDPAYTRELDPWRDRNTTNCPVALSPIIYDRDCFRRIRAMAGSSEVLGMQSDWGCWVALVNGAQALKFFRDADIPQEMENFLQTLKDDQLYALVALET